jgi:hypothetical protein
VTILGLSDVGESTTTAPFYTHYTTTGASRLDRINISPTLQRKRRRVEMIVATFTDHLAVVMRMESNDPELTSGRGFWRMNTTLLRETDFKQLLQEKWEYWRTHKKYYPTTLMWWERYVKRMSRKLFTWEETERRCDRRAMEDFYYEVINTMLCAQYDHEANTITLKSLKAKITRLQHEEQRRLFINTGEEDRVDEETPTLYHFIRARKRHVSRAVQTLQDSNGVVHTTSAGILRALKKYMRMKFDVIPTKTVFIN